MAIPPQRSQSQPPVPGTFLSPPMDPALAQIFTDITTYMGTTYSSMTCTQTYDGQGTRQTATATYVNSTNNWQYMEYNAGSRVTVSPITATLGSGATQQFTATATDASGNPISGPTFVWSMMPGAQGTVDQTGLYTAPAAAVVGNDVVRCSLGGSTSWATVTVSLHP